MKIEKLDNMTRGWFIGDFEPSILRTKDFEAGIVYHKKGELWPAHYHAIATEYNVLVSGKVSICNEIAFRFAWTSSSPLYILLG